MIQYEKIIQTVVLSEVRGIRYPWNICILLDKEIDRGESFVPSMPVSNTYNAV